MYATLQRTLKQVVRWLRDRWRRLTGKALGPQVGDLLRHEGHVYVLARIDGTVALALPEGAAPWRDVAVAVGELRRASGDPVEFTALTAQEALEQRIAASNLPDKRWREQVDRWALAQPAKLGTLFTGDTRPYWYLPGRLLQRYLLRSK